MDQDQSRNQESNRRRPNFQNDHRGFEAPGNHRGNEGGEQHRWNRNRDGGDRDTQRDDRQRTSFGAVDSYEDGPHYYGSGDLPSSPDRERDRKRGFRPLEGSFTHTVDRQNDYPPASLQSGAQDRGRRGYEERLEHNGDWSGYRELDRDANRELHGRRGSDYPRTSSVYGSRANDMSRGSNPYGYGLGDSNYNDSYYGRGEDFSRQQSRYPAGREEGIWDSMKESVKGFFGKGPKGYKRSDERIKEDVCEVLARHPGIDASEIEVHVEDGLVSLRGDVDSRFTKRRAEEVIDHISGVHDVQNELRVRRPDVDGGLAQGSGTGTGLGATSPVQNQSGASLFTQTRPGGETAVGSTGTAGTTGSNVNAGTGEAEGAKRRRGTNLQ